MAVVVGERHGRTVVVAEAQPRVWEYADKVRRDARALVRCDCGIEFVAFMKHLRSGRTQSCGCLNDDNRRARKGPRNPLYRHGGTATPAFHSWRSMLQRCLNPNASGWKHYGGRGVRVCERWLEFANFLEDMGERPAGRSLDRINNNGHYEPGNCRWATPKEQRANQNPRGKLVWLCEWPEAKRAA